jgi:hypothetical protein
MHAEIEGMRMLPWLEGFLDACRSAGVRFCALADEARRLHEAPDAAPACLLDQGEIPGRSGRLAVQGADA